MRGKVIGLVGVRLPVSRRRGEVFDSPIEDGKFYIGGRARRSIFVGNGESDGQPLICRSG